jgi:hypothetical protein
VIGKRKPLLMGVAVVAAIAAAAGLGFLLVEARPSAGSSGTSSEKAGAGSSGLTLQRVAVVKVSGEAPSTLPDRYRWRHGLIGVAAPAGAPAGSLYVFRSDGVVTEFRQGRPVAKPFLDLRALMRREQGMLVDLVFAPDYARTHRLYAEWLGPEGTTHVTELRSNGHSVPASSAHDVYRLSWMMRLGLAMAPNGRLYLVRPSYAIFWIDPRAAHPKPHLLARLDWGNVGLAATAGAVYVTASDSSTTRIFRLPTASERPFYLAYPPDDIFHPFARTPPGTRPLQPILSSSEADQPCRIGEEIALYRGSKMPDLRGRLLVFSSCSPDRRGNDDAIPDSQGEHVERQPSPRVSAYRLTGSGLGDPISLGELQLPPGTDYGFQIWQDGRGELYLTSSHTGEVFQLRAS